MIFEEKKVTTELVNIIYLSFSAFGLEQNFTLAQLSQICEKYYYELEPFISLLAKNAVLSASVTSVLNDYHLLHNQYNQKNTTDNSNNDQLSIMNAVNSYLSEQHEALNDNISKQEEIKKSIDIMLAPSFKWLNDVITSSKLNDIPIISSTEKDNYIEKIDNIVIQLQKQQEKIQDLLLQIMPIENKTEENVNVNSINNADSLEDLLKTVVSEAN